jgi:hypothetical protein
MLLNQSTGPQEGRMPLRFLPGQSGILFRGRKRIQGARMCESSAVRWTKGEKK